MNALRFSAALLLSAGLAVGRGAAADFPPYPQSRTPIDLKAGTVAGFGVALHDFRYPQGTGRKTPAARALFSTATETGKDLNEKPYLLPLMVLGE